MPKNYEQEELKRAFLSQLAREEQIRLWAALEVQAMLIRVRNVCITELQWQIDALRES